MGGPNPVRTQAVEAHEVWLLCTGADGADLTVTQGAGASATVVRTGEGAYTITITGTNPGTFKGWHKDLWAATPGDLKGYTVVRDTPVAYDGSTWTLPFTVYNASVTAADLIVDQGIDITLKFGNAD